MKKLNLMIVLAISLILLISTAGVSQAAVSGSCSLCHTMHFMQNGKEPVDPNSLQYDPNVVGPFDHLTNNTCLGCHGGAGTGIKVEDAPDVFGDEANMTAGGTFNVDVLGDNTYVHNVIDITWTGIYEENDIPSTITPGLDKAETVQLEDVTPSNLSCAGTTGCHGAHGPDMNSDQGIKGFHHGSEAYRYCRIGTGEGTPVEGVGAEDWEAGGADINDHNVYGADKDDGISAFCAQCHGNFHNETDAETGDTGAITPFIRHPTDNLLKDANDWDLSLVTIDYDANPFAFLGSDIAAQGIDNTTDYASEWTTLQDLARVACVSCHRAHGSQYKDILRFDYSLQEAGSTTESTGCLGCHEKQRGKP